MPLRDLREDLRPRLRAIEIERAQLQERLTFLAESEKNIGSLLRYEHLRVRNDEQNLTLPLLAVGDLEAESKSSKLTLFLRDKLADGRTWTLGDLKLAAHEAGLDFGGKQPGRVLHFALLGMSQNRFVEMVGKGVWRMVGANNR